MDNHLRCDPSKSRTTKRDPCAVTHDARGYSRCRLKNVSCDVVFLGAEQFFVIETNRTRVFPNERLCVEKAVFYMNAFLAAEGWYPIAGGNLRRPRAAFEVDPLTRISTDPFSENIWGATFGVQLFRHHEDNSWIPEIAYGEPGGAPAVGFRLRYLQKMRPRTCFEGLLSFIVSDDHRFDREEAFASYVILF